MNQTKKSGRSWWREHFIDHPGLANKDQDAYVESDSGITKSFKVYCEACLPVDIEGIIEEDLRAISQGRITEVRNEVMIETYCALIDWFSLELKIHCSIV